MDFKINFTNKAKIQHYLQPCWSLPTAYRVWNEFYGVIKKQFSLAPRLSFITQWAEILSEVISNLKNDFQGRQEK